VTGYLAAQLATKVNFDKTMIDERSERTVYEALDKLPDGRTLKIRTVQPDDKDFLQYGMHHLSKQSLYFRFFTPKEELTEEELAYFTQPTARHVGLVAAVIDGEAERPAGVGRYFVSSNKEEATAELAFAVIEEFQGLGIATILLKHLIEIARSEGIAEFTAFVLPENIRMIRVLCNSGLPMKQVLNVANVYEVSLSLKKE
jgi:GNAT superfamily N-acetyltransferase